MGGCQFIINVESLPSFLSSRQKNANVCVPFQKKKIGGIPEKKKRIQKTPKKRLFLLKERKKDGDRKKENDHANVSLIKKLNKKKKKRKEKKEKSVE